MPRGERFLPTLKRLAASLGEPRDGVLRVLVFPCGSEVASEVMEGLASARQVEMVGASSVSDHGEFLCADLGVPYFGELPYLGDPEFLDRVAQVCAELQVDYLFPCMDLVARALSEHEDQLSGARVVSSPAKTAALCANKRETYAALNDTGLCPRVFDPLALDDSEFPVFLKPAVGYGARDVLEADTREEMESFLQAREGTDILVLENLPGAEYTVDCFTSSTGELRFCRSRLRDRIRMGISVRTYAAPTQEQESHQEIAARINAKLELRGAWFFQLKDDSTGRPRLLEVAARLGGSSGLARQEGVNLPLLSLYDRAGHEVMISPQPFSVIMDRALNARLRTVDLPYRPTTLYVDFDDCLVLSDGRIHAGVVSLIVEARNTGIEVVLLSRHAGDLEEALAATGLRRLFDGVVHLTDRSVTKASRMDSGGLLIDDSFREISDAREAGILAVAVQDLDVARAILR